MSAAPQMPQRKRLPVPVARGGGKGRREAASPPGLTRVPSRSARQLGASDRARGDLLATHDTRHLPKVRAQMRKMSHFWLHTSR